MRYSVLGTSGMRVSQLALGTALWGVAPLEEHSDALLGAALDAGINVIDTSNAYGNLSHFDRPSAPPAAERASAEEIIGRTLGSRRDRVVLCTKAMEPVGPDVNDSGLSRRHLTEQLDHSLRRLRTDHVDVFYAHHPDADTPLEQTLRTLDGFVRSGKVREYALSTYPAWQTTRALWIADREHLHTPVCVQVRYSLVGREAQSEVVPVCREFGLSIVAFSPLSGGLLGGTSARSRDWSGEKRWGGGAFTPSQLAAATRLEQLADAWGHQPAQLAVAWVLTRPAVAAAVIGPETPDELAALLPAVEVAESLDSEQWSALDEVGASGIVEPVMRA